MKDTNKYGEYGTAEFDSIRPPYSTVRRPYSPPMSENLTDMDIINIRKLLKTQELIESFLKALTTE